jgi:flagellar hook-associated protein 1 FlgK
MSLFSIGTRAMNASYASLQTTGHNIANVNTAGYSRQEVDLTTNGGQFTGAGYFGKGVRVETVSRAYDSFLAREVVTTRSLAAADATRLDQLRRLEAVFPPGENGIGFKAGAMLNAFADVAARPQDAAARQVVLARAEDLVTSLRAAADKVESLQSGVNEDLVTVVGQVNALATSVAAINQRIAATQGMGHDANDLLDQRDQLVREIAAAVGVTTLAAEDGSLNLFAGGGQILVLGGSAATLSVIPDEYDPTRSRIAIRDASGERPLDPALLSGGALGGLLRFQNEDLAAARVQLGQIAAAFASRVNEQQSLGVDLGTPPGAGRAIFDLSGPQVLPGSGNARDATGAFLASYVDASGNTVPSVSLTVVDPSALQASEYDLQADPGGVAGQYLLTRRSDGVQRTIAAGDSFDGLRFDVPGPAPGPNDRFSLRPVSSAARDLVLALRDPRGIAAAGPLTATSGTANTGTASVSALRATSFDATVAAPFAATITFTDDAGSYDWQLLDGAGGVVAAGSATWQPGQPIRSADWGVPGRYQWEMGLSGAPRSGDTLRLDPTAFPGPNNLNAQALLSLRDERLLGRQVLAGGGVQPGVTVTDAWARSLADIGLRVQTGEAAAQTTGSMASEARAALASTTGVNLDEEAARLIQFQQSYQAAAKVLQVAQSVFDILLQATSR